MHCRLLVSVRDLAEAEAALRGGCDWLDIKSPERGPLGRPDSEVVQDILSFTRAHFPSTPVSVALGELREWARREPSQLPYPWQQLGAVKMGFAGSRRDRNWADRWVNLSHQLECPAIAVAYADAEHCDAPPVDDVLETAMAAGNLGLLVDTHTKAGPSLSGWIPLDRMRRLCQRAQAAGLLLSLAGKVDAASLAEIVGTGCDVLGVRSAACAFGDRSGLIEESRVRSLKCALSAAVGIHGRPKPRTVMTTSGDSA